MKKFLIIPLFALTVGLFALMGANKVEAFSGSFYDKPACTTDWTDQMFNYLEIDNPSVFNRNDSTWVIGYFSDYESISTYLPLMIIYTDKDDTGSYAELNRNISTGVNTVGIWTGTIGSNSVYIAQVTNLLGDNQYPTVLGSATSGGGGTQASFVVEDVDCINGDTVFNTPWEPVRRTTAYDVEYPGDDAPVTDLDYYINFSYTATNNSLTANYLGKVTEPTSSLADPDYIWWQLRDPSDPDLSAYEASVVCEATLKKDIPFNLIEHCPGLSVQGKTLWLVGKVNPLDNENIDTGAYNVTWLDNLYKITFTGSSFGSTESCDSGASLDFWHQVCIAPESISFVECFQETFPFLDLESCTDNMKILIGLLSFRTITFANDWTGSENCHDLTVLGEWMGIPNYTVCPAIPQFVRTIVTPFITLALGLTTITFLSRREGYLQ